jgi:hypothetical protein
MADLGQKHTCDGCGKKFYDLGKESPACPKCGNTPQGDQPLKIDAKGVRAVAASVTDLGDDVDDQDLYGSGTDDADDELPMDAVSGADAAGADAAGADVAADVQVDDDEA